MGEKLHWFNYSLFKVGDSLWTESKRETHMYHLFDQIHMYFWACAFSKSEHVLDIHVSPTKLHKPTGTCSYSHVQMKENTELVL